MVSSFSWRSALLVMVAALYAGLVEGLVAAGSSNTVKIPNKIYNGNSNVEFTAGPSPLDGQKITPYPNLTQYEWWYFDVASTSSADEHVVVVFYESNDNSFLTGPPDSILWADIMGSFPNGTAYNISALVSLDSEATLTYQGQGVSGVWGDSGFSFQGSSDLSKYVVTVNNPEIGVKGTITLQSSAPAHYPCGPAVGPATEVICPTVGWSNAVPAAQGTVDLQIGDTKVHFTGIGYHDKNWGDANFVESINSWYWGHAEAGPYELVWFDAIPSNGKEYVSGYIAENGKLLFGSCAKGAVTVRPIGSSYPPKLSDPTPTGYTISYNLGPAGIVEFTIKTNILLVDVPGYQRYMGPISGGPKGAKPVTGKALGEQFVFVD